MVIGLDCAEPDLVFNRWLTKSAAYEAGPDQNQSAGFGRLTDQRHSFDHFKSVWFGLVTIAG